MPLTRDELIAEWTRAFAQRRDQLVNMAQGETPPFIDALLSGLENLDPVQVLPIMYATAQAWALIDVIGANNGLGGADDGGAD